MPLSQDDVREILRLIDESPVEEIRAETGRFTLYALREGPGVEPVAVAPRVDEATVVGLIEVMKMMNAVPAGVAGTIMEVCATNAEVVEYGAPLFRVEPDR